MAKSIKSVLEEVRQHDEYWETWLVSQFTEELCRRMEALRISRKAFAERIGHTPAYVTQALRGDENLTAKTMAKLARAVGSVVRIHLAPVGAYTTWIDLPASARRPVDAANLSEVVFTDVRGPSLPAEVNTTAESTEAVEVSK